MTVQLKDQVRRSVWLGLSMALLMKTVGFIFDGEALNEHLLSNVLAAVVFAVAAFGLDQREEWDKGKRWTY